MVTPQDALCHNMQQYTKLHSRIIRWYRRSDLSVQLHDGERLIRGVPSILPAV